MGFVHAEIELVNFSDELFARRYIIGDEEVRRTSVKVLVDSGAYRLCINENIQAYLGLEVRRRERMQMANGEVLECDVAGPVKAKFADRETICDAYILPGDSEPLLGGVPMEDMDVHIHPLRQELITMGEYGERPVRKLMTLVPPSRESLTRH